MSRGKFSLRHSTCTCIKGTHGGTSPVWCGNIAWFRLAYEWKSVPTGNLDDQLVACPMGSRRSSKRMKTQLGSRLDSRWCFLLLCGPLWLTCTFRSSLPLQCAQCSNSSALISHLFFCFPLFLMRDISPSNDVYIDIASAVPGFSFLGSRPLCLISQAYSLPSPYEPLYFPAFTQLCIFPMSAQAPHQSSLFQAEVIIPPLGHSQHTLRTSVLHCKP